MLKELTIDSLDGLFDFLNQQKDIIFWIRNADYQRQMYVSPTFEQICKRPPSQLYEHPESFFDYLVGSNRNKVVEHIDKMVKKENPEFDGTQMFRMITPNNDLVGFKQTIFALLNSSGEHIGFAGIGKYLPDDQWHQEFFQWEKGEDLPFTSPIKKHIIELLKLETNIQAIPSTSLTTTEINTSNRIYLIDDGAEIYLTKREQECLDCLVNGLSAKETARILKGNINHRTVEFHLKNIKDKTRCRTQAQLLSKVVRTKS